MSNKYGLKELTNLSFPVYLELLSSVVSGFIDTVWVAKLGGAAVAAVAVATALENALLGIILIITLATTVYISNYLGQKKTTEAQNIIYSGAILYIIASLCVIFLGIGFRNEIAYLLIGSNAEEMTRLTVDFFEVMFPGVLLLYGQWYVNSIFKGHKNTKVPMKSAFIANAIILVLDPVLIFGLAGFPALGVKGAALATVFGRFIALVWTLWILLRSDEINIAFRNITVPLGMFFAKSKDILILGTPLAADFITRMLGSVILIRIINNYGTIQVAAYGIGYKVLIVFTMAFYAIRQGSSILVSRRIGEGYGSEARLMCYQAIMLGIITAFWAGCLIFFLSDVVVSIFTLENDLVIETKRFLSFMIPYLFFISVVVTLSGGFIGLRKGNPLIFITMIGVITLLIGAVGLDYFFHSVDGIWVAMILSALIQVLLILIIFEKKIIPTIYPQTIINNE